MCAVLNISSKTYYKYRNKEDTDYYDYCPDCSLFCGQTSSEKERRTGYINYLLSMQLCQKAFFKYVLVC